MFSWARAFLVSKRLALACFPHSDLASYNLILSELFCGLWRDLLWSSSELWPACEVLLVNQRGLLSRNTKCRPSWITQYKIVPIPRHMLSHWSMSSPYHPRKAQSMTSALATNKWGNPKTTSEIGGSGIFTTELISSTILTQASKPP